MDEILITGGTGQVGIHLRQLVWPIGVKVYFPSRAELDLTDVGSIESIFAARRFLAVINCAADTAVDRCETSIVTAWKTNALAPAVLGAQTARQNIPLIHLSTDYVFDGSKPSAYDEQDAIAPINVYGASKAGGEHAVRTSNARHAIVRTSWIVSAFGNNFVKTMLRLGVERDLVHVVNDQWGAPTHAGDLAQVLAALTLRLTNEPSSPAGTYNFSNTGSVSWYGVADEIFRLAKRHGAKTPQLEAISTAQYPLPARRPANSRLAVTKIGQDYAIHPRAWQLGIEDIVRQLLTPVNVKD